MNDVPNSPAATPRRRRIGLTVGLIGAGIVAGAIGATAFGASAQPSSPSPSAASTPNSASAPGGPNKAPNGPRGSAPVRSDEKSVSASVAATLKAAAVKAVPGGSVYRIETDAGDGTYEAHMTRSDGTLVTVKFDSKLKVTKVESGMGSGDPAPGGLPGSHH